MKEMNGVTPRQLAACFSQKILELTIFPTEKCNFRCTYCYEDFVLGRMKPHIVEGLQNLIRIRSSELSMLRFRWFGGEPLLALPVIEAIARTAVEESVKHGFLIEGSLTTNAYDLSVHTLERLVELKQSYFQVSLDGWKEVHDKTRKRADGKGTFDQIWANMVNARDTSLDFTIAFRVHVTGSNEDSVRYLCRQIHGHFGSDPRFIVDFQDVRNLGGENADRVDGVSFKVFSALKPELRSIVENGRVVKALDQCAPESEYERAAGESSVAARLSDLGVDEPYVCYAAKPNHILIRSNGRVGKCTVALADERNDTGYINPDGTIFVDQKKQALWHRGFSEFNLEALGCPLVGLPGLNDSSNNDSISIKIVS